MTGKDASKEVKIRSYRDSPIRDAVVVVHGTEMVLRCPDYRQAMRWARLERKSYKIPEPDIDVAAKAESGDHEAHVCASRAPPATFLAFR